MPLKSMTAFSALTAEDDRAAWSVTLRALNHRYLDLQVRVPPALGELESRLRAAVQRRLSRGRVELTVSVQPKTAPAFDVELNGPFVEALAQAIGKARDQGLVAGALQAGDLLRFPQAVQIRERSAAVDGSVEESLQPLLERTLEQLDRMRAEEGANLEADLARRLDTLAGLVTAIERLSEQGRERRRARLLARIDELTLDLTLDKSAIAQEVARAVMRSDVTEELLRLRSHLDLWKRATQADEPCGRKLDFLIQEMNREINTIGSKTDEADVTALVVAAKSELEKMREQIQNVE